MYGPLKYHPAVSKLLVDLEQDTGLERSVGEAARSLNVSVCYLQHLLRRDLATSYHALVRKRRVERLRCLILEQPGKAVSEIAYENGLSPQTLYRHFKSEFGLSPSHLRRRG